MKKEIEIEKKEDQIFGDIYDIIKHLTTIHSKETQMSEDYVLFEPEEKQKKFIIEQLKIANHVKDYIKNEKIGNETGQQLIKECNHLSILERNKKNNFIIRELLKRNANQLEEEEIPSEAGILKKTINKLNKKKEIE